MPPYSFPWSLESQHRHRYWTSKLFNEIKKITGLISSSNKLTGTLPSFWNQWSHPLLVIRNTAGLRFYKSGFLEALPLYFKPRGRVRSVLPRLTPANKNHVTADISCKVCVQFYCLPLLHFDLYLCWLQHVFFLFQQPACVYVLCSARRRLRWRTHPCSCDIWQTRCTSECRAAWSCGTTASSRPESYSGRMNSTSPTGGETSFITSKHRNWH